MRQNSSRTLRPLTPPIPTIEARAAARGDFAPVRVVSEPQTSERGVIHVVLASGERMTIGEGTSIDLLRTVMSVLRTSC
jgi:hypothetical protein